MTPSLYHPVLAGERRIDGNVFLAPLAGFTDIPFRVICKRQGADLVFSEMVSAEGLSRNCQKTGSLMDRGEEESSFVLQLFGANPRSLAVAAQKAADRNPLFIDLNCGCPVPKVVRNGAGAALMRTPDKIGQLVRAMRSETDIPITVKIRSGWDSGEETYLFAAESAEKAGAAMITLHPRSRNQLFRGRSNWTLIKRLKENSSVPVCGSGDILTAHDALAMLSETKCDAIMLGRGAVGNPFLFSEIRSFLSGEALPQISLNERFLVAFQQIKIGVETKGEERAVIEGRKHLCAYLKGFSGAAHIRKKIVYAKSLEEVEQILFQ